MSPRVAKKQNIIQTMHGYSLDYQMSDKWPFAVGCQRKIAMLANGRIVAPFYIEVNGEAKLSIAYSVDAGMTWKVERDIFSQSPDNELASAWCPALTVDSKGLLHLACQGREPQFTSLSSLWYSNSNDGISWSTPVQLPLINPRGYHSFPVIATGSKGNRNWIYIAFEYSRSIYFYSKEMSQQTWASKKIAATSNMPPGPSMAVARNGTIYIAYCTPINNVTTLFCAASRDNGANWNHSKVFSRKGLYITYPSIAVDSSDAPVIAYSVRSTSGMTDPYRAIHVSRRRKISPGRLPVRREWMHKVLEKITETKKSTGMPTVSANKDGLCVVYVTTFEDPSLDWTQWPHDLVYRYSKNGARWSKPQRITKSQDRKFSPQGWPNLYWQIDSPKDALVVLWDGKEENAQASNQPWHLRCYSKGYL